MSPATAFDLPGFLDSSSRPFVTPSVRPAPSSSSCQNTRQTSTPSSRSLPNLSTCCVRPQSVRRRLRPHRQSPRRLHAKGMQKLPSQIRLCANL